MGLTKAYLLLTEAVAGNPPTPGGSSTKIEFQFNPEKISMSRSAHWIPERTNSQGSTTAPEYKGPAPTTMKLAMFLDASDKESGDVSPQVDALFEACAPTPKSVGKGTPLPAFAIFGWDKVYFKGFIKSVSVTYSLFRESGKPVRATCDIELTETPGGQRAQNPTSGNEGAQAVIQLVDGDSLAAIAFREYGDAGMWRVIAEANEIDDPMRLKPGVRLLVPAATEVAP